MKKKMTLSLKQVTFACVAKQYTASSDIVCTYLVVVMNMTAYRHSVYKCNVDRYLLLISAIDKKIIMFLYQSGA